MTKTARIDICLHDNDKARAAFLDEVQSGSPICAIRDHGIHLMAKQDGHVITLRAADARSGAYSYAAANFWAREPSAFHLDGGTFYSRFVQGCMGSFLGRHVPIVVHLVQAEDNARILRHVAEINGTIETDVAAYDIPLQTVRKLYAPEVRDLLDETLGSHTETGAPSALSMELDLTNGFINWRPGHFAWVSRGHFLERIRLNPGSRALLSRCAPASLSVFDTGPQYRAMVKAIHQMGARGEDETFEVLATRSGLAIVSCNARSTIHSDGVERAVSAITAEGLSGHEIFSALRDLEFAVNAALRSQLFHISENDPSPREISLSMSG